MIPLIIAVLLSMLAGGLPVNAASATKTGFAGKAGLSQWAGELPSPGRTFQPQELGTAPPSDGDQLGTPRWEFRPVESRRSGPLVRLFAGGPRGRAPPVSG